MKKVAIFASVVLCLMLLSTTTFAGGSINKSRGQSVYTSAAYLDFSNGTVEQYVFTRLIIRNIDPDRPITVNFIEFYDQNGNFVKNFAETPITIDALKSITILASNSTLIPLGLYPQDPNGGRSYFLIDWEADKRVITPIIGSSMSMVIREGDPGNTTYKITSMIVVGNRVLEEK
jgi:Protein of unknown function (DUF3124)